MGSDHYFSASPASAENLRRIRVTLAGRDIDVTTAGGIFSPDHVDTGTKVLLAKYASPASRRKSSRPRLRLGPHRTVSCDGVAACDRLGGRCQ